MSDKRAIFEYLLESGIKLQLRATTRATATLLLAKFLRKLPLEVSSICPYAAGASCLYLAGKIEEDFVKVRDVTNVCYSVLHPSETMLDVDEKFWNLRDGISNLELFILRTLSFRVQFNHPHKYLLCYLESLRHWVGADAWPSSVQRSAFTVLSDCYVQPELLTAHTPQTVALAVLYIVLRVYGVSVPSSERWWLTLYADGSTSEILELADSGIMASAYGISVDES